MAAAERLQGVHLVLGLASTALATAAAATIVASLSKLTAGILTLLAAIVSGVLTFMKPERTAEQHLAAGRQLNTLRVHARQVLNLDLPSGSPAALRKTIDEIARKKPPSMTAHLAPGPGTTTWPAKRSPGEHSTGTARRRRRRQQAAHKARQRKRRPPSS